MLHIYPISAKVHTLPSYIFMVILSLIFDASKPSSSEMRWQALQMLCSIVKVIWNFRETNHFHVHVKRVSQVRNHHAACFSCLAFSSVLKVEAVCFSEMSVGFHQTTQCYISEDRTFVFELGFWMNQIKEINVRHCHPVCGRSAGGKSHFGSPLSSCTGQMPPPPKIWLI